MKSTKDMIELNQEQAKYYDAIQVAEESTGADGHSHNRKANVLTRFWSHLRERQRQAIRKAGIEESMKKAHSRWVATKAGGSYLEIGCFSGSPSTFALVEAGGKYLGVELSQKAVSVLNSRFEKMGMSNKARAVAVDLLTMEVLEGYDLIYAHAVLHHFENPVPLFDKLASLLKPDGVLIFVDPVAVNPVYRVIRSLYRPFQSDAAWEWPFNRRTIDALESQFEIVEGFGWGARSLPLSVLSTLPFVGGLFGRWYVSTVASEVGKGWHTGVWNSSMVTALARRKR